MRRRLHGNAGVVGVDAVAFGVLVCMGVTMAVLHGWAVIDAASTARMASGEAARAAVGALGESDPHQAAEDAAGEIIRGLGHTGEFEVEIRVAPDVPRCTMLDVTVRIDVVSVLLAIDSRAAATASRLVDPFRDGPGVDHDRVPCAG